MPEHLRALVVIMLAATLVFAVIMAPACTLAMDAESFRRRRNAWIGLTLAAFLAHNFWLFIIAAALIVRWAERHDNNKMALFHFLLFAVPALTSEVSGLGIIRHFFAINPPRLLALVILLPAWLALRQRAGTPPLGSLLADRFLLGYLFVALALQLTADTFTNTLRYSFYAFIDVFLPYYVASRSLRDLARLREVVMAFVVASIVMVPIAVFEFSKSWLLYSSLDSVLGVAGTGIGTYLERGEVLRAMASIQHPIALGYVMAVATGMFLFLRRSVPSRLYWLAGFATLVAGLIAPVSRGPWLGALVVIVVFLASGARATTNLLKLGAIGLVSLPPLLMSPLGVKIMAFLPFVGNVEVENITYRERLIEIALDVIADNPWFGGFDFIYSPAMQELKQGQGIIDIVNSYVAIALSNGLVGLSMFVLFFATALRGVAVGMWRQPDKASELHVLGQALLACLTGVLVMIFTVSGISVIPVVYWSLAGMCVAYGRIEALQAQTVPDNAVETGRVTSGRLPAGALRGNQ